MIKMLKKFITIMMITVMMLTLATGCAVKKEEPNKENDLAPIEQSENTYPMEIVDGFGNKITLEKQPTKIVSLAPSHTEILFELGLDEEIVGVTPYCVFPEKATTKEKVGDAFNVNIEKILELNPDIVIQYGPGKEDVNSKLSSSGIAVLGYAPESIDEVIDLIEEIGRITNKTVEANSVTQEMLSKKDTILNTVKEANKPKVFFEVWDEPLQTAGPGSFIDELISLAGGDNIANDAQGAYAQFDLEQLIERNPDVYLTSKDVETKTIESIKSRSGFNEINAIKNDRVYILDPLISIPGPRIVQGLEIVAKSIHPELFD
ncbi:iron complex transport system substrate-binding protein [Proteiniborus ethanoligenes]|uniref:Iron complex transport system substrate-binding protein n=1 Tax=Proteiniborus ethanoligenes TaxID=415015 RepID=A0A1H3RMI3_9FIRM|nr:cobalamin-binding protein [Proteiniborus ethanoligenes]SDZ26451.1 iron complex transport system substrate-binding protein [Proteiniborus ethanoligenes]